MSWSGNRSQQYARILRSWFPQIIQQLDPYVSTEDMPKGSRWSEQLFATLDAVKHGLISVTSDNQTQPWINFEAGALSKFLGSGSVTPILIDMEAHELSGPLAIFQSAKSSEQEDMFRLASVLNAACPAPISAQLLEMGFIRLWPDYLEALNGISNQQSQAPARSSQRHDR